METVATAKPAGVKVVHIFVADDARPLVIIYHRRGEGNWGNCHWGQRSFLQEEQLYIESLSFNSTNDGAYRPHFHPFSSTRHPCLLSRIDDVFHLLCDTVQGESGQRVVVVATHLTQHTLEVIPRREEGNEGERGGRGNEGGQVVRVRGKRNALHSSV